MNDTTFFAGVALKVAMEMQYKWHVARQFSLADKEQACKEAWEWAYAMSDTGPKDGYE